MEIASSNIDFPRGGLQLYRLRAADPICMLATQPSHHINGLIGHPSNMLPATRTATRSPCNSMSLARFMLHGIYLYLTCWDLNKNDFANIFKNIFHFGNNLLLMKYQTISWSSAYLSSMGPPEGHFVQASRKNSWHTQRITELDWIGIPIEIRHILDSFVFMMRIPFTINSSPPSTTCMCQWTGSALVQVMACCLFGTKTLPEPMIT